MTKPNPCIGLDALITPQDSVLLMIDHQPAQFSGLHSHDPQQVITSATFMAKAAKLCRVPTVLTSVVRDQSGDIIRQVRDVFPDQTPIDRTTMNAWEDHRVVDAVKATGRKNLLICGLWTEVCLSFPSIHAMADGYRVFAVADASGGSSLEAHERAIQRMIQAGVVPTTSVSVQAEWQRDWARTATVPGVQELFMEYGGSFGTSLAWEKQLLGESGSK